MYFGGKTQTNFCFASMQRTHYPKYVSYFGNGSGRDQQVIINNGGLTKSDKGCLGNQGYHFARYNSNVSKRPLPGPANKPCPTFYYKSDGSGRDSYVLMDNGGMRPEYDKHHPNNDKIFTRSLRCSPKSQVKYFRDHNDKADITTYLNWKSKRGQHEDVKKIRLQRNLVERLYNSPSRSRSPLRSPHKGDY